MFVPKLSRSPVNSYRRVNRQLNEAEAAVFGRIRWSRVGDGG
jgi:hypothetical protein